MLAITIKADDAKVRQALRNTDARMLPALGNGLSRGLQSAAAVAQHDYLHGPRPSRLDVVSTRLQGSLVTEIKTSGTSVVGRIGTNIKYAAYHEFGYHGIEQVKGFTRAHTPGGKAAARKMRRGSVPFGFVRAHSRNVNYPGKPFLRPALEQTMSLINRELQTELTALAQGGTT